ncbi:hypothetical protein CWO85_03435 [Candidatus Phytoplasma ziziphi]|uniref:Uncharacterized protein n=1 Tax=Ziziphus jujuba witches'-broom phytoplasma TaxID=135727 RepID=A0A660HND1_ZIZJU|nr:hypothetical protein [Candidatus Phytoplasma ziziphi]AYJ01525.1 hypothetical protein CWO85_03435 [Candidatus Phytoplasma ziziphi]
MANDATSQKKSRVLLIIGLIIILFFLSFFIWQMLSKEETSTKEEKGTTSISSETDNNKSQINDKQQNIQESYDKATNEADFFRKIILDAETQKCFYKILNLNAKLEEDFKMNTKDILNLLKDKPISFALKNTELQPNSHINLFKETSLSEGSGTEQNLYDFKDKPNLKLKINKKRSLWGEKTYIQVQLLSNAELLLLNDFLDTDNPKINLVTTNLTLYKDKV